LEPLDVPKKAWQVVSMDFITGLPLSAGISCILVVVDTFSKFSHFIPIAQPFTATSVAKVFIKKSSDYTACLKQLYLIGIQYLQVCFGRNYFA
jgi:hypothetical protein